MDGDSPHALFLGRRQRMVTRTPLKLVRRPPAFRRDSNAVSPEATSVPISLDRCCALMWGRTVFKPQIEALYDTNDAQLWIKLPFLSHVQDVQRRQLLQALALNPNAESAFTHPVQPQPPLPSPLPPSSPSSLSSASPPPASSNSLLALTSSTLPLAATGVDTVTSILVRKRSGRPRGSTNRVDAGSPTKRQQQLEEERVRRAQQKINFALARQKALNDAKQALWEEKQNKKRERVMEDRAMRDAERQRNKEKTERERARQEAARLEFIERKRALANEKKKAAAEAATAAAAAAAADAAAAAAAAAATAVTCTTPTAPTTAAAGAVAAAAAAVPYELTFGSASGGTSPTTTPTTNDSRQTVVATVPASSATLLAATTSGGGGATDALATAAPAPAAANNAVVPTNKRTRRPRKPRASATAAAKTAVAATSTAATGDSKDPTLTTPQGGVGATAAAAAAAAASTDAAMMNESIDEGMSMYDMMSRPATVMVDGYSMGGYLAENQLPLVAPASSTTTAKTGLASLF